MMTDVVYASHILMLPPGGPGCVGNQTTVNLGDQTRVNLGEPGGDMFVKKLDNRSSELL